MRIPFCPQERKLIRLLERDRWPHDAEPALRRHAEKCGRCSETVLAIETLRGVRASDMGRVPAASSGQLWWRAQLRRRTAAAESALRPLAWVERLALVAAVAIAAGFGIRQRVEIVDLFGSFAGISILAGLGLILCVGGLALYLSERSPNS